MRATRCGAQAAVLVPVDEWRRLQSAARPSLKQLLLSDLGRVELTVAARGGAHKIQAGIELTRDQDASKAAEIEAWLDLVASAYNVLPMDGATYRVWPRLMHRKSDTLYEDAMIAATATVHKLTVVTRNVADFAHIGVSVLDPFSDQRPPRGD